MSDPETIWLSPACTEDCEEGRTWCADPQDCQDCDQKSVKYTRSDLGAAEIERLRAENVDLRAQRADMVVSLTNLGLEINRRFSRRQRAPRAADRGTGIYGANDA